MSIDLRHFVPEHRKLFWSTVVLLVLYAGPLVSLPILFWVSAEFTEDLSLYTVFLLAVGPRETIFAKLEWLLAPLLGLFCSSTALRKTGSSRSFPTIFLVLVLVLAIVANLITHSILSDSSNLASLNAHEAGPRLDSHFITGIFERYQEVLLTLLLGLAGIKVVVSVQEN